MRQIAQNAGRSGDAVVEQVRAQISTLNWGFNAATGTYEDMIAAGILDPLKAVKEEIVNALSVAMLILRADAVIAEELEEAAQ